MKIFHFVYNYWGYSGATNQAKKISRLMEKGNDIYFLNSSNDNLKYVAESSIDGKFVVIDLPTSSIAKVIFLFYLFVRKSPQILHCHGYHRLPIAVSLFFRRIKVIMKCTLLDVDDLGAIYSRPLKFFNRVLILRVDKMNCLNELIFDINREYLDPSKLCIIPNGVDEVESSVAVRENIFLIVGAVVPRKNVCESIKYFENHVSAGDNKLLIVGPNDPSIQEFEEEYSQLCKKMADSAKNNNIFFTGQLEHGDILKLFNKSKGLLFFSKREGTPNVVLEALACNCPVIFDPSDSVVSSLIGESFSVELSCQNFLKVSNKIEFLDILIESKGLRARAKQFSTRAIAGLHLRLYEKLC